MYEYIKGNITELTPASVIVETGGIGYFINISLTTYTRLNGRENVTVFLQQIVREDAHLLYGFADRDEREIFRLLISVNGIGANTAVMMLSSYQPEQLRDAIATENVNVLKSIKGIGAKTAQRVIIDLKDKIGKSSESVQVFDKADNTTREEALSALVMLGFNKRAIEKALDRIFSDNPGISVEETIKIALKNL
ncbi:Holliday junction branch migration protein RuvA [Prolixibacter denitrificans]|uniref:Holliday junction branch migration complex subunit RuvA n=1 Tax=Prolixibacter denitrificans TaxID=1541063 RepID=A0A2P8CI08_9BACT|nr:Holliday junction branch migration protein RuvA [Prolixibacter denitrificans]PSK84607.1 Holliday junction DNA helicase RuvA [Prolixibacter denitrificans]GET20773.1 Holliday junction ATP-dependent DNA helicase RuvA [Prolixibacter denitrificans]